MILKSLPAFMRIIRSKAFLRRRKHEYQLTAEGVTDGELLSIKRSRTIDHETANIAFRFVDGPDQFAEEFP